jgi:hypothetical protein
MAADTGGDVTAQVVDALWLKAIAGSLTKQEVHERAEARIERVSAQNPVVNSGMLDLHGLTRSASRPSKERLTEARTSWKAQLDHFEADPETWMRDYYVRMLRNFTDDHGVEKGRAFAMKLVRSGEVSEADIPPELRT